MAIAEMSTMTVIIPSADKEKLLDALQKTGAAQLKKTREFDPALTFAAGGKDARFSDGNARRQSQKERNIP